MTTVKCDANAKGVYQTVDSEQTITAPATEAAVEETNGGVSRRYGDATPSTDDPQSPRPTQSALEEKTPRRSRATAST